jgi:hypothetical protein
MLGKYLFAVGQSIGYAEAQFIANKLNIEAPLERVHLISQYMACAGWGHLEILSSYSFKHDPKTQTYHIIGKLALSYGCEASAWQKENRNKSSSSSLKLCHLTTGFLSGWFTASFGTKCVAAEVKCCCSLPSAAPRLNSSTTGSPQQSPKNSRHNIHSPNHQQHSNNNNHHATNSSNHHHHIPSSATNPHSSLDSPRCQFVVTFPEKKLEELI